MTKEITKAYILQQLQNKFKLRDLIPEKFTFGENVVPVYDISQHLIKPEIVVTSNTITATGAYTYFTVPGDERWHVHGYNVIFVSGVYTLAGVMINRPTTSDWFYLDLEAAQTVSYINIFPKDVVLEPGEDIAINVDGYTSTGSLQLRVDATLEKIR